MTNELISYHFYTSIKSRLVLSFLFLFTTVFNLANGQNKKDELKIISQTTSKGIEFRILPKNYEQWKLISEHGIQIDRYTLPKNIENATLILHKLTPQALKPAATSVLDSLSDNIPEAVILRNCIASFTNTENNTIGNLIQSQQNNANSFSLSMIAMLNKPTLAYYSGLAFADLTVAANENYLYRLYLQSNTDMDTSLVRISSSNFSFLKALPAPQLTAGNGRVSVTWNLQDKYPEYYGLYIEKSIDNGNVFSKINANAILFGTSVNKAISNNFIDSVGDNPNPIFYRILGISFFGSEGAPSAKTSIRVFSTNSTPASYLYQKTDFLHWDFAPELETRIVGFKAAFCDSIDGNYRNLEVPIISPSTRRYKFYQSGYYKILTIDSSGNSIASLPLLFQLTDSTPPNIPQINKHQIDSNGIVKIEWNRAFEKDFYGYKVYQSNFRNDEFAVRTPFFIKDTFFIDTIDISMHRDSIFYQLVAADNRFNESLHSIPFGIQLPDLRKPATPVIYKTTVSKKDITLFWTNSNNNIGYFILKRNDNCASYNNEITIRISVDSTQYSDSLIEAGCVYEYSLMAMGKNQKLSDVLPTTNVRTFNNPILPKITFNCIAMDSTTNKLAFYWEKPMQTEISHYRILEINANGVIKTLGTAKENETTFQCPIPKKYKVQNYSIIVYLRDGRRSIP